MTLRPPDTVQKLLFSTPARLIAEFEADGVILTHAWAFKRAHDEHSPLHRTFLAMAFTTPPLVKAAGVEIPDYSPTGDLMCALMAVLFGKRFDNHGAVEMTGHFRVPDLASAADLCEPERPYHGSRLRADFPVSMDLSELARFRVLIDGGLDDAPLAEAFRTAALFYARALRTIGRDPEVAYIHLITACERLAEATPFDTIELEAEIRTALVLIEQQLPGGEHISRLFRKRMRQVKRRFAALISSEVDDAFFTRSEAEGSWERLQAGQFPRAVAAAYDLRSRYVHTGASFGSWIAPRYGNAERQSGKPVLHDREMAKILARAPTFIGLERLTRLVLLRCAARLGADLPDSGGPSTKEDCDKGTGEVGAGA